MTTYESVVRGPGATQRIDLTLDGSLRRDLAPAIHRQRLVVEGIPAAPIGADQIVDYLRGLSEVCGMRTLIEPVTHRSDRYGWAGWIHWETSGAHFYAWETPQLFFSVDIYTCKAFDEHAATDYTAHFFGAVDLVAQGF
ncbi:MAG: S-adenosylmethionine decarboxylase [Acidimicrobiia bacterium]